VSRRYEHAEHLSRPRLSGSVVFGLVLVFFGVAFLLDNLGVIYAEDLLNFWPCVLIALGLMRLWNHGFLSVWGQLLVAGGLLWQMDIWWKGALIDVWWPVLVVWAGLFVALKAFFPKPKGRVARECGDRGHNDDAEGLETAPVVITHDEDEECVR